MTTSVSWLADRALRRRNRRELVSSPALRTLTVALSLTCLLATATARAEEAPVPKPEPSLLIRLDGGLPASNLARVLNALQDEKVALRTLSISLSPGTRTCDLLALAKLPPPCGEFLPYIGRLNPGANLNTLAGVSALVLPDLKIEVTSEARTFTRANDSEKVLDALVKNWAPLNARITEQRSTEVIVEYQRYAVQMFPGSPEDVTRAARVAVNLNLKNSAVEVKGLPTANAKLFGDAVDDAKGDCESLDLLNRLKSTRKYLNWFDRDTEAERLLSDTATNISDPVAKVGVRILDTPVLLKMPNLDGKFTPGNSFSCKWQFDKDKHHGNHLASIIASQDNGTGFFGIEPAAQLDSFNIRDPAADSGSIADYLENTKRASPQSIYLFATGIAVQHLVDPVENWQRLQFRNKSVRTSNAIYQTANIKRPLMIVAAGQVETRQEVMEISALTNLFPQNLGDFPNVIVVTACQNCKRGSAQLLSGAFYSEAAAKFVHVAAPGGTPIPGWTSDSSMGAAAGTSQASAYVAGVAASMLSRYPSTYAEPGAMKYRLQMCSYPLPAATPDRTQNFEANRLAAGVVDPGVCLLDPTRTWVKKKGGKWMAVSMKGWTDPTMFYRKRTTPVELANRNLLRVIRTDEEIIRETQLALYVRAEDNPYEIESGLGQIRLVRAGSHSAQAGIVLCDDKMLPLSDYEDIIVASQTATCGLAPP